MKKITSRILHAIVYLPLIAALSSCDRDSSDSAPKDFSATNLFANPSTNIALAVPPRPLPGYPTQPQTTPAVTLNSEDQALDGALKLSQEGNQEAALQKVAEVLNANPKSFNGYLIRGQIYSKMNKWVEAKADFQSALDLHVSNPSAQFNLCELHFAQKQYDEARGEFEALKKDPDLGDLAAYKVFLCDLFAGHDEDAKKELDAFNAKGSNASYYFSNAAWDLYHDKPDDAHAWLRSAQTIYYPYKFERYASSLVDLGYLPGPSSVKTP